MPQSFQEASHQVLPPLSLGVCSWSLQVKSIRELKGFLEQLGHQRRSDRLRRPAPCQLGRGRGDAGGGTRVGDRHDRRHAGLSGRRLHDPADDQGDRRLRQPRAPRRADRAAQMGHSPHDGAGLVATCRCTRVSCRRRTTRAGPRFSRRWPRRASWPRPGASRWLSRPARRPPTCSA